MRALLRSPDSAVTRVARALVADLAASFEATRPAISTFLSGPPPTGDPVPALASIVQRCFPAAEARHRRVYESLGCDPADDGRVREAAILARLAGPRRMSGPGIHAADAWLTFRTRLLAQLSEHDSRAEPADGTDAPTPGAPNIEKSGRNSQPSWWSLLRSRLR